jgi:hypothetical protein
VALLPPSAYEEAEVLAGEIAVLPGALTRTGRAAGGVAGAGRLAAGWLDGWSPARICGPAPAGLTQPNSQAARASPGAARNLK